MTALDLLWSRVVRAEQPLCLLGCGRAAAGAHHILRRTRYPQTAVKYEPDFGAGLCVYCHEAVERNWNGAFARILQALGEERAARILAYLNRARDIDFAPVTAAQQRAYLRARLKRAEQNWMDREVDMAAGNWRPGV